MDEFTLSYTEYLTFLSKLDINDVASKVNLKEVRYIVKNGFQIDVKVNDSFLKECFLIETLKK